VAEENEDLDEKVTMPQYFPGREDILLSLIHAAFKIRSEIMLTPGHTGLSVSEKDVIACVPDSLFMFLSLLFGGQTILEDETDVVQN